MKYLISIILSLACVASHAQTEVLGRGSWMVLAAGHPAESKSNSTTSDQDYTSLYTLPANTINENTVLRITILYQFITGSSTALATNYVKFGSTKVFISNTANYTNSITASFVQQFYVHGTGAAASSVSVETSGMSGLNTLSGIQTVTQPVSLATDGTLAITPGITYSATGGTESMSIRAYTIEILN